MVERGYSEEDKDKMVEAMLEEGWQRSDNLPQVWPLETCDFSSCLLPSYAALSFLLLPPSLASF